MIHQESLFFVLPFFFITTTWNSGQLVFTGLLGAAGLVTITDPLYYRWLAPRRWLFLAMHTLALFAALLTALPIILNLTTSESYKLALGTAVLLSIPSLAVSLPLKTWRGWLVLPLIVLALGGTGWLLRSWVPPATLWMTEVAVTTQLQDRTPGESIEEISVSELRRSGLYAYTSINAPRGLNERIYHVWQLQRPGGRPHRSGYSRRAPGGLSRLDPQTEFPAQPRRTLASTGYHRGWTIDWRVALSG